MKHAKYYKYLHQRQIIFIYYTCSSVQFLLALDIKVWIRVTWVFTQSCIWLPMFRRNIQRASLRRQRRLTYVSPKRWQPYTRIHHGVHSEDHNVIPTAVKTSNRILFSYTNTGSVYFRVVFCDIAYPVRLPYSGFHNAWLCYKTVTQIQGLITQSFSITGPWISGGPQLLVSYILYNSQSSLIRTIHHISVG